MTMTTRIPVTMQLAESLRVLRTFTAQIEGADRAHCEALADAALARYEAEKTAHRPQLAPIPAYEALADREAFGLSALRHTVGGLVVKIDSLGPGVTAVLGTHLNAVREMLPPPSWETAWVAPPFNIRTWEMDAAPAEAERLTDEQRRSFKVDVAIRTSAVAITLTRLDANGVEEEDAGLNVMVEVSQGLPAVHLGPGPYGDHVCHAHVVAPNAIEVAADIGDPVSVPSTPYGATRAHKYTY